MALIVDIPAQRILSTDGKRFALAIFFSSLFHIALIVAWKREMADWQMGGNQTLTVSFRVAAAAKTQQTESAPNRPTDSRDGAAILTQKESSVSLPAPKTAPPVPLTVTAEKQSQPKPQIAHENKATPPGLEASALSNRGLYNALLTIAEGGEVGQIIWKDLPALTNAQLQRLESFLRGKNYGPGMAGRTVSETIDLRPFLTEDPGGQGPAPR